MKEAMASTVGLIPARGGSKGIVNKNLRLLDGVPLIAHAIRAGLASNLDRVIVMTDSLEIQEVALSYGAEAPILRPANTATDTAHMFMVYKFAMEYLDSKNELPHSFCALLPTTPLRKVSQINESILKIQSGNFDWVFTVNEIEHHHYRAMEIVQDQRIVPFHKIDAHTLWSNRQELPRVVRFNGGTMCGLAKHALMNQEYNIDGLNTFQTKVGYVDMSQEDAYDIDTEFDLEIVSTILKRRSQGA
jgi:CMP-N-acetylneuraminic acid synthetase